MWEWHNHFYYIILLNTHTRWYLQWILNETGSLWVSPLSFTAVHAYRPDCSRVTRCSTRDFVEIITPHDTFCMTGMPCLYGDDDHGMDDVTNVEIHKSASSKERRSRIETRKGFNLIKFFEVSTTIAFVLFYNSLTHMLWYAMSILDVDTTMSTRSSASLFSWRVEGNK